MPYAETDIKLNKGDIVVMYTDGVTETFNRFGEEYGEGKLQSLILENRSQSAAELLDTIVRDVRDFNAGKLADDLTLIVIRAV
jgi:serine phosphatase RsbU (regulator of sigma subunit)